MVEKDSEDHLLLKFIVWGAIIIMLNAVVQQNSKTAAAQTYDASLGAPVIYIPNNKKLSESVKLKQHTDGTLWACSTRTDKCFLVE